MKMALKGIKVLEFGGLAPGPFCGMILADFGASVTRIDRYPENHRDVLKTGKRTIAMNIKDVRAQSLVKKMSRHYDVLVEPFRPGVMEKVGLGPTDLLNENPRLIYARLSGFGQTGPLAKRAGHDINYIALSGILSMLGRKGEKPLAPINLVADFAGGGLLCAFGILAAIVARERTGEGQVVDCSMTEGAAYVGSWLTRSQTMPFVWGKPRGENLLDSGIFFYDTYETKDGQYMSVGCIEPQFFDIFVEKLGLKDDPEVSQFMDNEKGKKLIEGIFLTKTQAEWSAIFENSDACVYPVVNWQDAPGHQQNKARDSFLVLEDTIVPKPAPKLSKTPAESAALKGDGDPWKDLKDILVGVGINETEILKLIEDQVILATGKPKL